MKRLKREFAYIGCHLPMIGVWVFLCCIGGILLWVNGDNHWYAAMTLSHPGRMLPISTVFILWLFVYGLTGAFLGLILLTGGERCVGEGRVLCAFSCATTGYLLMLVWYALFFCTRLTWFASVILLFSCAFVLSSLFLLRGGMRVPVATAILILAVECAFVFYSFSINLLIY